MPLTWGTLAIRSLAGACLPIPAFVGYTADHKSCLLLDEEREKEVV